MSEMLALGGPVTRIDSCSMSDYGRVNVNRRELSGFGQRIELKVGNGMTGGAVYLTLEQACQLAGLLLEATDEMETT